EFKKQRYNKFYANVGYHNVGFPDSTWLFGATFDFHDFRDQYSKVEDRFCFNAYGEKRILGYTKVGANVLADVNARTSDLAAHSNTVISIIPYIKETRENWEAAAKLNLTLDNGASFKPYFYPTISFTYMLANRTLMPYVEISGHHQVNTYEGLAYENPYLSSQNSLDIENTKNKVSFIGGIKGRHRSSYGCNIWVSYSFIDDMYFYVNDIDWLSPSNLENSFFLAYSGANVFSFNTELALKPTRSLDINFTYSFNSYNLDNNQVPFEGAFHKALNRPKHNLLIQMRYDIWSKITCNLDFGLKGSYYARRGATFEPVKRGAGIDLSIGTEYKFFNSSSVFIQLNNITDSRYHVYNSYRTYGFNVVFGYMYAF
ncbi:MAG: hypothetical protein LBH34_04470, partial [Prevotellaceae bacterium]|nr:hypothetical protein [Prevotellaceae bacterium]